uniref:Uncharacterized protein n=1 Tax=Amphimedon queenslandica TaxID=400682 RepID=A0A1X7TQJ8_AMPQE
MEVLLEYGSSKRELKLSKDEDVFQALEEAFQQFEPGLSIGFSQQRDVKPSHFLQRYSEKWRDYTDVSNKREISNGDKIRAVNVSQVLKRGSGVCVGIIKPSVSNSKQEDETVKVLDLTSEDDTELTQEGLEDWQKF